MEEWEYLEGQHDLYKNIKVENHSPLSSPDGSRKRNPPESPRPLYSPDSTQEDHTFLHHHQGKEFKYIKAEIKTEEEEEEEEMFVREAQQSVEEGEMTITRSKHEESSVRIDAHGSSNRNPPKRRLRPLLPRMCTQDDRTNPRRNQDEESKYIKAEIKEEEDNFVGGAQQFMEEGEMIMRGEQEPTSLHIDTSLGMMASKFTSPGFLPHFISMYRSLPCLWKIKSKEYFDRSKRNAAYAKLAELCRRVYAKADIVYVKSKIANLRTVFKKELNKICASKKSGSDEVYVPRLWYFESLRFLDDEEEPKKTASNAHPSSSQPSSTSPPVPDTDSQEEPTETRDNFRHVSPTPPPPPAASTRKAMKRKGSSEKVLSKLYCDASAALQQQSDECAIFGRLAASKLRRMSSEQRQIVEPLIYQLLNKGLRGEATLQTHIAEYSKNSAAPPSQQVPQIAHFCRFPNARP